MIAAVSDPGGTAANDRSPRPSRRVLAQGSH
jgi:hypothetical protein